MFRNFKILSWAVLVCSSVATASPALRTDGPVFRDPEGRVVVLRGVNLSADSKNPPFAPLTDGRGSREPNERLLDPLPGLGFNTVRLMFFWEAYEPEPGRYDEAYLDRITRLADAAWERGLYVLLDLHQDGYSRYLGTGCGVGFPAWAVPERYRQPERPGPEGDCSAMWATGIAISASMHGSFHDFYADTEGARSAFLGLWFRLAAHFASHPGVIGYDIINEPWGKESSELPRLYEDTARVIHFADPSALIFAEPEVFLTTFGFRRSELPRPVFANAVYAPHFYDPFVEAFHAWGWLLEPVTDNGYKLMAEKAAEWGAPLFVGEFGVPGTVGSAPRFLDYQYDRLDERMASSAQWDYTPAWTPDRQDGWNHEDLSIVDGQGRLRRNFHPRPYAERTYGTPLAETQKHDDVGRLKEFEYRWRSFEGEGETVIFVPAAIARSPRAYRISFGGRAIRCFWSSESAQPWRAVCRTGEAGEQRLRIRAR